MKKIILSLALLPLFIGTSYSIESQNNEKKLLKLSKKSSKELLTTLKTQLTSALKTGNAEAAVSVCSVIAPEIANKISKKNNLIIKRVSLKNRNPNGKPDDYEEKNLESFNQLKLKNNLKPNHEVFSTVKENGETYFRYMKPIVTVKSCLQCHGSSSQVSSSVKNILTEKYPKDIAFGYKEGDVRGAVSIKIKM